MIVPPKLTEGDTVGITAPARKISRAQMQPAIDLLGRWGLKVRIAPHAFSSAHPYLAGTDDERRQDLQDLIDDPEVRAIFCARGGYGTTRLVDDLDFTALQTQPRWVVGFSDVTALHLKLTRLGLASVHGTMPLFFGRPEAATSVEHLRETLFSGAPPISLNLHPKNRCGQADGKLIGGNLSLIVDALGTSAAPEFAGSILVVEEVDEYHYKLDRMFTQLRRSGALQNLAGLVVGHMTDMKDSELPFGETADQIIAYAVRDYSFPVAFGFPSGHDHPNLAWIHGTRATLEVSAQSVRLASGLSV